MKVSGRSTDSRHSQCYRLGVALFGALAIFLIASSPTVAAGSVGFIENRGQVDMTVSYYADAAWASIYFTPEAVVIDLKEDILRTERTSSPGYSQERPGMPAERFMPTTRRGCALWVRFKNENPSATIEARGELACRHHFFLGNNPEKWQPGVPAFAEIVFHDLWPGVDLTFWEEGGALHYGVATAPGANAAVVRFSYEGATALMSEDDASVRIVTDQAVLVHVPAIPGERTGSFEMTGAASQDMARIPRTASRDNPAALVWSTFLGGGSSEVLYALTLDSAEAPIVVGRSMSADFPTTAGSYDQSFNGGYWDAFVAKISPSGDTVLWSTFLGGGSGDQGSAIAIDPTGDLIVTGWTASSNFPVTAGAFDVSVDSVDVFVAKLNATGSSLLWCTFLGGNNHDEGSALALDSSGNPIITGPTCSADFPTTTGTFDRSHNGEFDVFVAKLNPSGSALLWGTFLGGDDWDICMDIVIDPDGRPILTGWTKSADFPTTAGAYDVTHNGGGSDAFLTKLDAPGSNLIWSTFLGGGGGPDRGVDLELDARGDLALAGDTSAPDFPTTSGAHDETHNGGKDAFFATIRASGETLIQSTFLGGSDDEYTTALVLDSAGNPIVGGDTQSADFPTSPDAYDTSFNGGLNDIFLTRLSDPYWSTFLGGSHWDSWPVIALDHSDDWVVAGYTGSVDFPTTPDAYDQTLSGTSDVCVTKLAPGEPSAILESDAVAIAGLLLPRPNPFRKTVLVCYGLPSERDVDLRVFDICGRMVATLDSGSKTAGSHSVIWDGRDGRGQEAPGGTYFVRLRVGGESFERKFIRIR